MMRLRYIITLASIVVINVVAFSQNSVLVNGSGPPPTVAKLLERHNIALTQTALVAALRNPDAEVRYLAAQQLAGEGATDTIPQLVKALRAEKVPGTKVNIAYAIAQMGERKGFAALKSVCENPDMRVKRIIAAQYLLALHDESCLHAIMNILQSTSQSDLHYSAIDLLPGFQNASHDDKRKMFTLVVRALSDQSPSVRLIASHSLTRLGNTSAIGYLQSAIAAEKDQGMRSSMQADLNRLQNNKKED